MLKSIVTIGVAAMCSTLVVENSELSEVTAMGFEFDASSIVSIVESMNARHITFRTLEDCAIAKFILDLMRVAASEYRGDIRPVLLSEEVYSNIGLLAITLRRTISRQKTLRALYKHLVRAIKLRGSGAIVDVARRIHEACRCDTGKFQTCFYELSAEYYRSEEWIDFNSEGRLIIQSTAGHRSFGDAFLQIISLLKPTALELVYCDVADATTAESIQGILEECSEHLEELEVSGKSGHFLIRDSACVAFPSLRRLLVGIYSGYLDTTEGLSIAKVIESAPKLEIVSIGTKCSMPSIHNYEFKERLSEALGFYKALLRSLSTHSSLKILLLDSLILDSEGAAGLMNVLGNNSGIQTLHICNMREYSDIALGEEALDVYYKILTAVSALNELREAEQPGFEVPSFHRIFGRLMIVTGLATASGGFTE